jgi:hypothetical protein
MKFAQTDMNPWIQTLRFAACTLSSEPYLLIVLGHVKGVQHTPSMEERNSSFYTKETPSSLDCDGVQSRQVDTNGFTMYTNVLPSYGGQESVCKVKPESCHGSQKEAKVDMDSDVHGYCGDALKDTIQHLLYAEAQSVKAGNNGWCKPPANWGREFWRAFTFNSPS